MGFFFNHYYLQFSFLHLPPYHYYLLINTFYYLQLYQLTLIEMLSLNLTQPITIASLLALIFNKN